MPPVCSLLPTLLVLTASAAGSDPDQSQWTATEWISAVDARIDALPGLTYAAHRTTERATTRVEERWRMRWDGGSRFRIDYFGDTARQLASDGAFLVDYIPARRMAHRTDLQALGAQERDRTIGQVLDRVAIPGLRLGQAKGVVWTVQSVPEAPRLVELTGVGPADSGLTYRIHRDRLTLERSEIVTAGRVVLRTESSDHVEVAPGTWVPRTVRLWAPDDGGEVRVLVRLNRIAITEDPGAYRLALDPSIPVETWPDP